MMKTGMVLFGLLQIWATTSQAGLGPCYYDSKGVMHCVGDTHGTVHKQKVAESAGVDDLFGYCTNTCCPPSIPCRPVTK